jgi:hypothetical protein
VKLLLKGRDNCQSNVPNRVFEKYYMKLKLYIEEEVPADVVEHHITIQHGRAEARRR